MESIRDFEDILSEFERWSVRYLIVGGLAVIFHAKPRHTKVIDLWVDSHPDNIQRANKALAEFGAPYLITTPPNSEEILQLGLPPNRIDILLSMSGIDFATAWPKRVRSPYSDVESNWIDLDSLIAIKRSINEPRHQEDARVLEQVRVMRKTV